MKTFWYEIVGRGVNGCPWFIPPFSVLLLYQVYPKLSLSYYMLIDCLAQDHISYMATLEPPLFLYILESISQGLNALGMFTLLLLLSLDCTDFYNKICFSILLLTNT